MRQHYRRRSLSTWAFWTALLGGGTFYGAYRFEWFPVPGLITASTPSQPAPSELPPDTMPAPPDGRIEVPQTPPAAQSEPPVFEDDPLPAGTSEAARKTSSRLLGQRAARPQPKLSANSALPSSVEAP